MYLTSSAPEVIARAAAELELGEDAWVMVLVAGEDRPDLDGIVRALNGRGIRHFGGLFPGLLDGARSYSTGALLIPIPLVAPPVLIEGLDRTRPAVPSLVQIANHAPGSLTAIAFVDGLAPNISRLLHELHSHLGNTAHFIGGGAGELTLKQRPCVFCNEGLYENAAIAAFTPWRSRLGVRHGWTRLSGPFVATRAEGNVLKELNWQPAFEAYRQALEPHIDGPLKAEEIFRQSNGFPFGIYREGSEDVVRDPVAAGPNGELICVGEVPENAVLNVMRGDAGSLVEAAAQAADDCCSDWSGAARTAFVVDCVSRTLFLEERFKEELEAVHARLMDASPGLPMPGILSLGEISSHGEGYLEFLNKTLVTAVLHE